MKNIDTYKNKKVLVLGLAKSGVAVAKVLHQLGAIVTVNDYKPLTENLEAQDLLATGMRVITGSHPLELLEEDFFCLVKNPGIPYFNPMVIRAQELQLPILTDVEIADEISEASLIGITGTNGKTTTTTMIAEILNYKRELGQARLSGNIGYPASIEAMKASSDDDLVMELSSFQLLGITKFRPEIAVITNIYSAHLDYHGTQVAYVEAKWKIQQNMTNANYLVINFDQEALVELAKTTQATVIPFSRLKKVAGSYVESGKIFYQDQEIMDVASLGAVGTHNLENALAAVAVAKLKGIANWKIAEVLHNFQGVPHRLQFVKTVAGRAFYNDSKATNILATQKALSGFDHSKTILLAGGLDRGNAFFELVPDLVGLKGMFVFGQTAEKMAEAGENADVQRVEQVNNLTEAFRLAWELSEEGDNILLSPANASWDQYQTFEERGACFVELVNNLLVEEV